MILAERYAADLYDDLKEREKKEVSNMITTL
jgi:hypothetical protein